MVQLMEYAKSWTTTSGFGFGFSLGFDIAGGYESPISYLFTVRDNLLINPQFYAEVASHSYMEFITPIMTYQIKLDVVGVRFRFADI